MERAFSMLLALVLLLGLLSGCGQSGGTPAATEPEPVELAEPSELPAAQVLAEAVLPASGKEDGLEVEGLNRDADAERLAAYIEAICGLTADQWEDAAVIRGTGASAFEIVVLRLGDENAAAGLETVLADYLTAREGAFTGYAPAEAEMAANGLVRREERTVGLFICPDPEGAAAAFSAAYNGETLPAPAEVEPVEEDDFTPAFAVCDLMYRLLVEAACPDWAGQEEKAWTGQTETNEYKYGIEPDQYADFAVGYWGPYTLDFLDTGTGKRPGVPQTQREVAVFQANSEEGAAELVKTLDSYRSARAEKLRTEGEVTLAEVWKSGLVVSFGRYVALIVSDHTEEAALLFPRIASDPDTNGFLRRYVQGAQPAAPEDPDPDYPDRTRFVPPNKEDMSLYDTAAILAAWEARDPSGLGGDDREIYDAAEAILAEIMEDGMTDLEKETAAYGWLVNNVDYDWTHQDALAETDRRSYGPYGGLVSRAAVCLGYATSFQLLMDMGGVECITVVGACVRNTGDHAWNMVRLNGEWYCVDVTWDANGREQLGEDHEWQYFNLTSDEMAVENHQWDYANTPEARSTDRGGAAVRE